MLKDVEGYVEYMFFRIIFLIKKIGFQYKNIKILIQKKFSQHSEKDWMTIIMIIKKVKLTLE